MDEDFEFEEQALEDEIDNQKHWKSLGIASAVITVFCILIIVFIFILTPSDGGEGKLEPYTLNEIISQKILQGFKFNGTWISDHEFLYQSHDKNIILYDCVQGKSHLLTKNLNTTKSEILSLEMSSTRSYLLITLSKNKTKQRSSLEPCDPSVEYYVYNLKNGHMFNLENDFLWRRNNLSENITNPTLKQNDFVDNFQASNDNDKRILMMNSENHSSKQSFSKILLSQDTNDCIIQNAQWSPLGNGLLIMYSNDIYGLNLDTAKNKLIQLTSAGSFEKSIYNGINDQAYREFIFKKPTSVWWSFNNNTVNRYLCYLQVNNSRVSIANLNYFDDQPANSLKYRHPTLNSLIGQTKLFVLVLNEEMEFLETANEVVPPARSLNHIDFYVTHVSWTSDDRLIVMWMSRDQRQSFLGSCSKLKNWNCVLLKTLENRLSLKHVPNSVLLVEENSPFDGRRTELFICGQMPEKSMKMFYQLYTFNIETKIINSYLNFPDQSSYPQHYKVFELLGYSSSSELVFFVGQSLNSSIQSVSENFSVSEQDMRLNLFAFNLNFKSVHCITCQLVKCYRLKLTNHSSHCVDLRHSASNEEKDSDEESCIFQSAHLSYSSQYAIITCSIGVVPKVYLVKFVDLTHGLQAADGPLDLIENITLFEDNSNLESRIASKIIPKVENFILFKENERDGLVKYLRIKILTPPSFDKQEMNKYPLLFEIAPSKHVSRRPTENLQKQHFHADVYPDTEWAIHMVTEHKFIYGWLDGQFYQDTNNNYSTMMIYDKMSFDELADNLVTVMDFIQTNMTFLNLAHSCLIGRNIGAYFVLYSLSATTLECGIAISPLVNWYSTNSLISEQYLDVERLKSNDLSYVNKIQSSLDFKTLSNNRLLVIHGTFNDLFPVSQTMKLMETLIWEEQDHYFHLTKKSNDKAEANMTSNFLELYVNQANDLNVNFEEHFYKKIEAFLFHFV